MDMNRTQSPPVTERSGRRKAVPRAAQNASRGISALFGDSSPVRALILGAGGVGGVLLILSDFLTLYHVDVVTARCSDLADPSLADACQTSGGEHHGYALLILGVLVLLMTWGAAMGGSRPAGVAPLVLGAAALGIALGVDLPDIHKTGVVGQRFAEAEANPGAGFWLELVGAALVLVAGGAALRGRWGRGVPGLTASDARAAPLRSGSGEQ